MPFTDLLKRLFSVERKAAPPQTAKQSVPKITPSDVERIVSREFPVDQVANVMAILGEYTWQRERPRVQLAALKVADGDLQRLRTSIESANRDYRDVLAAAEYPAYSKVGFRTKELPADEQRRIMDSDWRQYEAWLRR